MRDSHQISGLVFRSLAFLSSHLHRVSHQGDGLSGNRVAPRPFQSFQEKIQTGVFEPRFHQDSVLGDHGNILIRHRYLRTYAVSFTRHFIFFRQTSLVQDRDLKTSESNVESGLSTVLSFGDKDNRKATPIFYPGSIAPIKK